MQPGMPQQNGPDPLVQPALANAMRLGRSFMRVAQKAQQAEGQTGTRSAYDAQIGQPGVPMPDSQVAYGGAPRRDF